MNFALWASALLLLAPSIAEQTTVCPIAVGFGSYCCGVDRGSAKKIDTILASETFKSASVESYGWGIEGESTLCIRPTSNAPELIAALRKIVSEAVRSQDYPPPIVSVDAKVTGRGPVPIR